VHVHIVASRIDPETGRSLTLDNDFIHGQAWAARWERDHGQALPRGLHGLMDALDRRDAVGVVDYLTRDKATFQPWEVNRALAYGDMAADERAKFRTDILGQANVIGLRETADAPVTRYTTREVLATEMAVQRNAGQLAKDERHGLTPDQLDKASAAHTLKPEQDAALRHLAGGEGFAVLWGEAGTGKSHTLNAARAAYEAAGKNVIGLAWTNDVAQQMRGDGFKQANTIASELLALEKGRTSWGRNTVLIVDEAAMLSTDTLAQVTSAAKQAGAKLILAGDDKQLSSIERGGLFETLRQTHGAAVLKDVQRVQDAGQKDAFGQMHERDFAKALSVFEKAGSIHWSEKQADTLKEMAARYTADVAAEPDKRRFMFAYTNKDVDSLNAYARGLHRERGDLGEDCTLATKHGAAPFAEGDRIQFTGNGRTKDERNAGLVNGRVGTVADISIDKQDRAHVTVELDGKKDQQPQRVSFVVGDDAKAGEFNSFKHGYAGTIYRGQGRTLDEVYVGHSEHWRSAASYVALTRHRESVHIFAARETVGDIEALAHSMARADNKRAATAYHVDAAELVGLEQAIEGLNKPIFRNDVHQAPKELPVNDTNKIELDRDAAVHLAQRDRIVRDAAELAVADRIQAEMQNARRFREEMERSADEAKKNEKERQQKDADRAAAGDITDAHNRYAQALGATYTTRDPYGSLANAAMAEYGSFNRQQDALRKEAAAEKDPDKRRLIELHREIEGHDYMAITSTRLAGISRAITMGNNASALRDDDLAKAHSNMAQEKRQERAGLQRELQQRERDERAATERGGLGSAAQKGAVAEQGFRTQARSPAQEASLKAADRSPESSKDRAAEAERVVRQQDQTNQREGLRPDQTIESAPPTREERQALSSSSRDRAEGTRDSGRQQFLRGFDREVPDDQQRDDGRGRDGGRERQRGE